MSHPKCYCSVVTLVCIWYIHWFPTDPCWRNIADAVLGLECPPCLAHLDWSSTCAEVAPKRVQLVAKLQRVEVAPNMGPCWPKFAPSGTCRVETVILDEFVPICKMCQFTNIRRIFWRRVDPEHAFPPTAVVPVEQIVHSYHLLLNYHPRLGFRCGRIFVFWWVYWYWLCRAGVVMVFGRIVVPSAFGCFSGVFGRFGHLCWWFSNNISLGGDALPRWCLSGVLVMCRLLYWWCFNGVLGSCCWLPGGDWRLSTKQASQETNNFAVGVVCWVNLDLNCHRV